MSVRETKIIQHIQELVPPIFQGLRSHEQCSVHSSSSPSSTRLIGNFQFVDFIICAPISRIPTTNSIIFRVHSHCRIPSPWLFVDFPMIFRHFSSSKTAIVRGPTGSQYLPGGSQRHPSLKSGPGTCSCADLVSCSIPWNWITHF